MRSRVRFVLVRPRRGGNVGAAARVMKNMGFDELWLVAPRTRVGAVGERMAAHARDVLARRRSVDDLRTALADCHLVVGTVGRATSGRDDPLEPRALAAEVAALPANRKVALVFGPEDHGLSNAELDLCQRLVRIPTAPDYPSLNLAQAVAVCAYELALAAGEPARARSPAPARAGTGRSATSAEERQPATAREREALIEHLERALGEIGFLSVQNPSHILRDVRALFARAGLTNRDVRIWRGIARQILWAAGHLDPVNRSNARPAGARRLSRRRGAG